MSSRRKLGKATNKPRPIAKENKTIKARENLESSIFSAFAFVLNCSFSSRFFFFASGSSISAFAAENNSALIPIIMLENNAITPLIKGFARNFFLEAIET